MFANILKELRAKKGVTQSQLAKSLGVSPGNVGDWETDKTKPGYVALTTLARFFEVSSDYLLEIEAPHIKDMHSNLEQLKAEQNLMCDGSPLNDFEADIIAMLRFLPEDSRRELFDFTYIKYKRHVEQGKESIYSTYFADSCLEERDLKNELNGRCDMA